VIFEFFKNWLFRFIQFISKLSFHIKTEFYLNKAMKVLKESGLPKMDRLNSIRKSLFDTIREFLIVILLLLASNSWQL